MEELATLGIGLGTGIANNVMDIGFGRAKQKIQLEGQKKALEQQNASQYDLWLKTNYPAQKGQLKAAGLNPGLMYGMSGGGGATAGAGGAMPSPIGGGKGMDIMGAAQIALLKAQKEKTEAETRNLDTASDYQGGAQTEATRAGTTKTGQEIENLKVQKLGQELQNIDKELEIKYKGATLDDRIDTVATELRTLEDKLVIIQNDGAISDATRDIVIKQARANLAMTMLEIEARRQGMTLTDAQIEKTKGELIAMMKNAESGRITAETGQKGASTAADRLQWDKTMNNVTEEMKLTVDVVGKILQAVGIKSGLQQMQQPTRRNKWDTWTAPPGKGGYELK